MQNEEVKNNEAVNEEVNCETAEQAVEEQSEVQEPETAVDEKEEKIQEWQNRYLRLQADFENFRRRNAAEREQLATFVTADVVAKFLKVLDNFERAENSMKTATDLTAVADGMEKIRRQFEQTFKELSVEEIPAAGEKFNPEYHEAVMRGQNPDMEDDTVDMVFEKGYKLRDKVIRHSKVRVISNE